MRRSRTLALLLVVVFAVPALAGSTLVVEISEGSANETQDLRQFDGPSMALGDFNGDGKVELVAHNDNQYVYVMSTDRAHIYSEFRTRYPAGWGVRPINSPVVADVDRDGRLEIVVVNSAAYTCVYEYDPSRSSSSTFRFNEVWCKRATTYDSSPGADADPWVEDVTGDGKAEIFMQTEEQGLFAYRHDGSTLWSKSSWGGNAGPVVTDLNGDGRKEVLFFSDGGDVRAVDAVTGSTKWFFASRKYVQPASIPIPGAAADVDGDGKKEVAFIARHATDETNYRNNHFMLFVLKHDGTLWRRAQPDWGNPLSYTHPVFVDVDGDGRKDVVAQDWNTIGHKPGNWERLGPANVFAYSPWKGAFLWRTSIDNTWSNDNVAVADPDGDGAWEVMAVGQNSGVDGVWQLDLRTGAKERHVSSNGWTVLRGPVAGDFNGDGRLDWAVEAHKTSRGGGAVLVYETDARCRVLYGNVQLRNPCDPPAGGSTGGTDPEPDPEPVTGDFDATFRDPGGNEWWVQVRVDANQPLAGVDARANGGSWRPLALKSWGAWAASFHVPDGSVVEFRARSSGGATDVSGGYRWPEGTPTSTDGGTGTFAPIFDEVKGNSWWVEVDLDNDRGVVAVDARVDGGSWKPLALKSWGNWAASFHVPNGAKVDFRARAADGATAHSGVYTWPPA